MSNQNFITLPVELWEHISQLVHKSEQTRFRRVSPTFSEFKPTMELCCSSPTNFELVTYLQNPKYISFAVSPQFALRLTNGKRIIINQNKSVNGSYYTVCLQHLVTLSTRDSIFDYMQGANLDPEHHNTWRMYRHLFHQRDVCKEFNIDPDECFIRFITENLPNVETVLSRLIDIILFKTYNRFSNDFKKAFPESFIFAISNDPNKRPKQIEWLRQQLQTLKPTDLKSI